MLKKEGGFPIDHTTSFQKFCVSGAWAKCKEEFVCLGEAWKAIKEVYVLKNGVWVKTKN
jgi:hypothetical protein